VSSLHRASIHIPVPTTTTPPTSVRNASELHDSHLPTQLYL
jgi:hypothetical protein